MTLQIWIRWTHLFQCSLRTLLKKCHETKTFLVISSGRVKRKYWKKWVNNKPYPTNIYLLKVDNRNTRINVWNMFKVNDKDIRTTSMSSFWCLHYLLWTYFTPFTCVSTIEFEQVNNSWVHDADWYLVYSQLIHFHHLKYMHHVSWI